jgi:hypothetical protein
MRRIAIIAALAVLVVAAVHGQQRPKAPVGASAFFSTIPIWPRDGVVPGDYSRNYVFLELSTGDLMVSYNSSLDTAPGTDPNAPLGAPVTFRVKVPRHVQPFIAVDIQDLTSGRFAYTYRVQNGSAARDSITSWHLDVSTLADVAATNERQWQTWSSVRVPGTENLISTRAGSHVIHWAGPTAATSSANGVIQAGQTGSPIGPGETGTGFRVVSRSRPGFVFAYFQGGELVPESSRALPAEVQQQLDKATTLEGTSWILQTLGPKYPPDMTAGQIVSNLLADMGILRSRKLLDENSPFIREAISVLSGILRDSEAWTAAMPDIVLKEAPFGPLETELAGAIKLVHATER